LSALDRSSTANEVHNDGDQGKEKQQVNQEAADVQDEETAEPEQNQHHSQNKKHERPSFFEQVAAPGASGTGHMSPDGLYSLLRKKIISKNQDWKGSDCDCDAMQKTHHYCRRVSTLFEDSVGS
jgi:hypothetical protein